MGEQMREVTMDEFYAVIGPQNVSPNPTGPYPYTSLWRTPSGEIRGKTVGYIPDGSALASKRFYLPLEGS